MKKYITTGIITVSGGVVSLSEAQAKRRSRKITALGKGLYRIDSPVQFKVGEEVGFEKTPKAFLGSLNSVKQEKGK